MNYKFIENIEKKNIDISLYIECSGNKKNKSCRKSRFKCCLSKQRFLNKELDSHNDIYEIFIKKFKSYFLRDESEEIKEIENTVNNTKVNENIIMDLNILNAMFSDIRNITKANKNYKKYINEIFSQIERIRKELDILKISYDFCYQKIYEPNAKGIFYST